mgnify:CR=1 FL=1
MNVVLLDRSGQARVRDIPDDLAEYLVPVERPTNWLSNETFTVLRQLEVVVFKPTGHWRCRLSPTGVSAWPVWQQQA